MAVVFGTDITEAAEYRVATSGSRPRDVGAKANGSLGDESRTRLSNGIPNKVFSSRFRSECADGGAKYDSARPWVDPGDEGDEGAVDRRGGP